MGNHAWSMGVDGARPLVRQAVEGGITTYDTANVYSLGSSEEITGQLLREFTNRDEVVIATKVHGRMGPGPKGAGLSRAAIFTQVDASLRRRCGRGSSRGCSTRPTSTGGRGSCPCRTSTT